MENERMDDQLESRIKDIMMEKAPESEIVDKKMEEAYREIRKMKTAGKRKVPIAVKFGTAAAILMLAMIYCVKNPAFAAQLPLIGNIFRGLEGQVSYSGDYSKKSITLPAAADDKEGSTAPDQADGKDSSEKSDQIDGKDGSARSDQAGGKGSETKSDQAGGKGSETKSDQAGGKGSGTKSDQADGKGSETKSDQADGKGSGTESYQAESGGITVTLSEVSYDYNAIYLAILVQNEEGFAENARLQEQLDFDCQTKMHKADGSAEEFSDVNGISMLGDKAEGKFVDSHTFKGIVQFSGESLDLSEYISCELTFCEFRQQLTTGKMKTVIVPDYGETSMMEYDWVHYPGTWNFCLDVDGLAGGKQETAVNDANAQGFGIEKVIKTEYEMYAVPILPEGEEWYDYIITIWDAQGEQLECHGSNFRRFGFYGRDISEVTVYLLRWEDFCESKGSNSYLQPSKAIYQTTVRFED